jgi:hypothetical protein
LIVSTVPACIVAMRGQGTCRGFPIREEDEWKKGTDVYSKIVEEPPGIEGKQVLAAESLPIFRGTWQRLFSALRNGRGTR